MKAPRWLLMEDQKPEIGQKVRFRNSKGFIEIGRYDIETMPYYKKEFIWWTDTIVEHVYQTLTILRKDLIGDIRAKFDMAMKNYKSRTMDESIEWLIDAMLEKMEREKEGKK